MASSKVKKAGAKLLKAKKRKIILMCVASSFSVLMFILTTTLLLVFPMSVVGGMVDKAKEGVQDAVTSTESVIDDFAACAELVGLKNDEFFANVKAFFGDSSELDARQQVEAIIKYAGLNQNGEETSYGNTMKAEASVVYEYFIKEYSDILKSFKPDENGKYAPEEGTLAGDTYAVGQKFIDEHSEELPKEEATTTKRTVTDTEEVVDPKTGKTSTKTTTREVTDIVNVHVITNVLLHAEGARVENEDGTVTVSDEDKNEFTNFFKPVFYTMAANALGTQNKAWGEETNTVDETGKETGNTVTAESFTTLIKLASKHSKDAFVVAVPNPPSKFKLESTVTTEPVTNEDGGTTRDKYITYTVEVIYKIQTKEGFIDNLIEDAYKEGEKHGAPPYDNEKDKNPIMAQVDALARFFGGELVDEESGVGIESGSFAIDDGWGTITVGMPSAGPYAPEIANYLELFANIDMTGCNDGATRILSVLKNIDMYYNNGVRFQDSGCLRTIQDMVKVAGYARPGYAGPNYIPESIISHGAPPSSGYSILTKSSWGDLGVEYGHIGIYFKTTDGSEYIFDNEGGRIKVHNYQAWVAMYGNSVFGYTGFGYY